MLPLRVGDDTVDVVETQRTVASVAAAETDRLQRLTIDDLDFWWFQGSHHFAPWASIRRWRIRCVTPARRFRFRKYPSSPLAGLYCEKQSVSTSCFSKPREQCARDQYRETIHGQSGENIRIVRHKYFSSFVQVRSRYSVYPARLRVIPTPSSASFFKVTSKSASDRPKRSNRHTSTISISRRRAAEPTMLAEFRLVKYSGSCPEFRFFVGRC